MNHVTQAWEEAFRWVLQTSWQAAVLAGLILVAQWILRNRQSAAWRYGLWLLLVGRLVMPATPQSTVSVFNLIRSRPQRLTEIRVSANTQSNPYYDVNAFNGNQSTNVYAGSIDSAPLPVPSNIITKPTFRVDWFDVALCGWLAGVCFFGARLIWVNYRFRSRLRLCQPVNNQNALRVFDECRTALEITQPICVIESEEVETPAVYGFWRKWLLLPEGAFERFGEGDLRCVFLHELAHIKRGDLGVNWLVSVLQVVHWFNPVLRLAFLRMRADREMAADALALAHFGKANSVAYGETILKVVENLTSDAARPGLVGIAESKAGLGRRVRAIAQFHAARHWKWAAVTAVVVIAGVGLTDARQTAAPVVAPSISATNKKPVREIIGVIVDPDGSPANGAQVAVMIRKLRPQMTGESMTDSDLSLSGQPRLFNPSSGHLMGEKRDAPWNYCVTGKDGQFDLDDLENATVLLVADKNGFIQISTNEFSTKMTVKLQPWGRIDGTVWHYNKVLTNELVFAYPAVMHDNLGEFNKFNTTTDGRGHFTFDYVPPGRCFFYAAGINKRFTVEPGRTTNLKVGGNGRTVIGRLKVTDPHVQVDWDSIQIFGELVPEPQRPSQPFDSAYDFRAWRRRPEVRDWMSKHEVIAYNVRYAPDGSFRIDQVEPGNYFLTVRVYDPSDTGHSKFERQAWWFNRNFYISASQPNDEKPLDLGPIEMKFF